jgi:hypothetical protein
MPTSVKTGCVGARILVGGRSSPRNTWLIPLPARPGGAADVLERFAGVAILHRRLKPKAA